MFVLYVGLLLIVGVQYWAGSLPITFWIFSMCVAVLCMYGIVALASGADAFSSVYLMVRAFVLVELIAS